MVDTLDPALMLLVNLRGFYTSTGEYYETVFHTQVELIARDLNLSEISSNPSSTNFLPLLELIIAMAVKCSSKETYISRMWSLPAGAQEQLMVFIQTVLEKFDKPDISMQEIIRAFKGDKRALLTDFEILKNELVRASRKLENLVLEKNSLKANLTEMETDLRQRSGSRSTSEIESFIRLEYETQLLAKNEQIADLKLELSKSESRYCSEIRRLKDELDVQSERLQQLSVLESSLDSYKKRLEDQHSLKRQIKELTLNQTELVEKLKKTEEFESHLAQLTRSAELLKEQLKLEKEKNANLHFILSETETKLQISENSTREYSERINILEGKLKERIKDEFNSWESGRSSDISLQKDFISEYEEKVRRLISENEALKETKDSETLIKHYNSELDFAILERKKAEERILTLEKTVLALNEQIEAEKNAKIAEKTHLEEIINENESEIMTFRGIQTELNEQKALNSKLEESLKSEKEVSLELKSQLQGTHQIIAALETQLYTMKSKISLLEVKLKEKSEAEQLLVKEIESFKSYQPEMTQLQGQSIKLIELERELTRLRGENASLGLVLEDKSQELKGKSDENRRVVVDLERKLSEEKERSEGKLQKLLGEVKSMAAELLVLRTQQSDMTTAWMKEQRLVAMVVHTIGLEMCQERFRARVKT